MSSVCDIEKLVELFKFAEEEREEDEENEDESQPSTSAHYSAKQSERKKTKISPYAKIEPSSMNKGGEGDLEGQCFDETCEDPARQDWKTTPQWDISYRQSVTASDAFLGMSFKNPSTSSCENMMVILHLPGENRQNVDLKVEKEKLLVTSPRFFLDLKLPHPVDPKRGNAQFDKEEGKLVVTLIMDRELDILNF